MKSKKIHRSTRQRQVILEELRKLTCHPTAYELYEIVRKKLPKISLGTVYRNLELMTEDEIINKIRISGGQARFDGDITEHYHVRCVECGRVDDISEMPDEPVDRDPENVNGYEILGFQLEYYGICPKCKKKKISKK